MQPVGAIAHRPYICAEAYVGIPAAPSRQFDSTCALLIGVREAAGWQAGLHPCNKFVQRSTCL
jgi:hypothetical protein